MISNPATAFINLKRFLKAETVEEAQALADLLLLPYTVRELPKEEGLRPLMNWGFVVPASGGVEERTYSIHELLSMTFQYLEKLATKAAGEAVRDVVFTVSGAPKVSL